MPNIDPKDLPAVEALLRESVPGRVYILYGRRDHDYSFWDLYFSLGSALDACTGIQEGPPRWRLEVYDPRPDGSGEFVGLFLLARNGDREPELYDAILGRAAMARTLGREPEYHPLPEAGPPAKADLRDWLNSFLPFELFCGAEPVADFDPEEFCALLADLGRFFIAQEGQLPLYALPLVEGLTQIASCPEPGGGVLEAAKAAAGALLHGLNRGELEEDTVVFPAGMAASNRRQAMALDLRSGALEPFRTWIDVFACETLEILPCREGHLYQFWPFLN